MVASIIGTFFVRSGEQASQAVLLAALRKGVWVSSAIIAIATYTQLRTHNTEPTSAY